MLKTESTALKLFLIMMGLVVAYIVIDVYTSVSLLNKQAAECEQYSNQTVKDLPAKCIRYFANQRH